MFRLMIRSVGFGLLVLAIPSAVSAQSCPAGPVVVQILGSGGPAINRERASAGYLLWVDGQAKLLLDMGGGTYLRFGQSQAKLSDLALVAISHLHPDHVSDLPALLWLSQQSRKEALPISGPSGNTVAPDFRTFLSRLFDEKKPAARGTRGRRQDRPGGGRRASDCRSHRPVRPRCGRHRIENILCGPVDRRGRSSVHTGSVTSTWQR